VTTAEAKFVHIAEYLPLTLGCFGGIGGAQIVQFGTDAQPSTAASIGAVTWVWAWWGDRCARAQPPVDHVFVRTTESKAAAAVRIGAALSRRKHGELLDLLRPCFGRVEPWLQAGKYVAALVSDLP
jgi:hypothetical protein